MTETITVYDLNQPELALPMERDAFYAEQVETFERIGRPSKMVEVIHVLLFDPSGEILIQQRSNQKNQNPGLLDKSIGGHIQYGDQSDYTVMVETVQELQVPSITLRTDTDFRKTYKLLHEYLGTVAVIKYVDTYTTYLDRVVDGKRIQFANRVNLFFGVYAGAVKNIDREAKGILFYTLDDLLKEIEQSPERFSSDLISLTQNHLVLVKSFIESLGSASLH